MMPAQAVSWLIEIVLPSAMSNESRTTTLQARGYGFESRWLHPCGSTQLPHNRVRRGCATTPKLAERLGRNRPAARVLRHHRRAGEGTRTLTCCFPAAGIGGLRPGGIVWRLA
jgi:hypothetical protein